MPMGCALLVPHAFETRSRVPGTRFPMWSMMAPSAASGLLSLLACLSTYERDRTFWSTLAECDRTRALRSSSDICQTGKAHQSVHVSRQRLEWLSSMHAW